MGKVLNNRFLCMFLALLFFLPYLKGQGVEYRYFEIAFRDKPDSINVYAATSDADVLSIIDRELQRPESRRNLYIDGVIERGTEYNNYKYDWHFVPNQWKLTNAPQHSQSIDPRYVEDQLFKFLGAEANYRPSDSYIKREITAEQAHQSASLKSIEVYPNPVARKLFVRLEDFPHPVQHVVLYDPQGRAVEIKEPAPEWPGTLQFAVEQLHRGYYTLSVRTPRGRWAEKVLIQ